MTVYDGALLAAHTNNICTTIQDLKSCARNYSAARIQRNLCLFSTAGYLTFVPIDILGPFQEQKRQPLQHGRDKEVLRLARARTKKKMKATTVANVFMNECMVNLRIPFRVLIHNCPRFLSKYFRAMGEEFGVGLLATTEYSPWTNRAVERFDATIVWKLWHHVTKNGRLWDGYVVALVYAYNTPVN